MSNTPKRCTKCQDCGKPVSHNAGDPAYTFCMECRRKYENEDDNIEVAIWKEMTCQTKLKYSPVLYFTGYVGCS